jgi:hypothetical protein
MRRISRRLINVSKTYRWKEIQEIKAKNEVLHEKVKMNQQAKHSGLREDILKLPHLKFDVLKRQEHYKAAKGLHDKPMETRPMYKWKHERVGFRQEEKLTY